MRWGSWRRMEGAPAGGSHGSLRVLLRYMDELMRLKAAAREEGCDFLTWNDIQACIDQVNLAVHEEHARESRL